jgi:hypothetical protein
MNIFEGLMYKELTLEGWKANFRGKGGQEEGWMAKKRDGWLRRGMDG